MNGKLLFASDPFLKQKWQDFKSFQCSIDGSFLNIKEKSFLGSHNDHSIPLENSHAQLFQHPKKNIFQLTTSSGSKFYFIVNIKEDALKWIEEINKASGLAMIESEKPVKKTSFSEELARRYLDSGIQSMKIKKINKLKDGGNNEEGTFEKNEEDKNKNEDINSDKFNTIPASKRSSSLRISKKKNMKNPDSLDLSNSVLVSSSSDNPSSYTSNSLPSSGFIGKPLHLCFESPDHKLVPLLVTHCVQLIEREALDNQGVYRVPGNTTQVNNLCTLLTTSNDLGKVEEEASDINVVTSLLKLFFRKMPDSLITTPLYKKTIETMRNDDDEERKKGLLSLVSQLPRHNFHTLKFMIFHLSRISCRSHINKMTSRNLAIVFGPTLICSRAEEEGRGFVRDMPDQCKTVETLLQNLDYFFPNEKQPDLGEQNLISSSVEPLLSPKSPLNKSASTSFLLCPSQGCHVNSEGSDKLFVRSQEVISEALKKCEEILNKNPMPSSQPHKLQETKRDEEAMQERRDQEREDSVQAALNHLTTINAELEWWQAKVEDLEEEKRKRRESLERLALNCIDNCHDNLDRSP